MLIGSTLLLLAACLAELRPEFLELFEERHQEVTLGSEKQIIGYRLFVPEGEKYSAQDFPLIVWLHGYGEHGSNNISQMMHLDALVFPPPRRKKRYSFFLLAVQCPSSMPAWFRSSNDTGCATEDMLDATKIIIEQLIREYPIDENRVYLAGVSSGGDACWEFAVRYPEMFAAVCPLGSLGGGDISRVDRLTGVPVWTFHSVGDSPSAARRTVHALNATGGAAHLTEIDSKDHDCWTSAFQDFYLLAWLMSQERDRSLPTHRPGVVPWTWKRLAKLSQRWEWWQIILQIGVPTVITLVILQSQRRRRGKDLD